jgi:radical SAM superfamily enzyme YgiQ (UPF0313 family)
MSSFGLHPADVIGTVGFNEFEGLSVCFINMPLRETAMPTVIPEGPLILGAILRKYGVDVSLLDLNAYRIKDELSKSKGLPNGRHLTTKEAENLITAHLNNKGDQDIVAISGKITTLKWQEIIAQIVRRLQPDCFLVSGGGLATEIKAGLFNWIPELDAIARSEGDDVILAIAKDVKLIKELGWSKAIKSGRLTSYYKGDVKGKPRFIYEGNRPRNLDSIPFAAVELLESDPYGNNVLEDYIVTPVWGLAANNSSATPFNMKRSLTTLSSRGCPYDCAFCYRGSQGERNYGMRSAENLVSHMQHYIDKYNIDFIGFVDDNFAVDKKRIKTLPGVFDQLSVNLRWGTHTRMDEADERAHYMAEAGCIYIGFGAESAAEHTLVKMRKGGFILKNGLVNKNINGSTYEFPVTMVDAIKNCKSAGIHANCTWIMGYPGEALEHLKTSVAFILWQEDYMTKGLTSGTPEYEIAKMSVNQKMFTATAYPGTAMWKVVAPGLKKHFEIAFDKYGDPICDDNFHRYVLELDDATKVLNNEDGDPVNFGDIRTDTFLRAREYADNGQIEKILELA